LAAKASRFLSDTVELCWDVGRKGAGYFIVNTPRTKLFTGFPAGRTFSLGDVELRIGRTRLDWATVSMTVIEGEDFSKAGRILIAATGLVENQGMELQQLGEGRVTLGNRWGGEPIMCEGVPAEILLPVAASRVKLFPLDEHGDRREAVSATASDGKSLLSIGRGHKTVWYEVEIR
jgi:hypothetical protein